jgi:alpha-tubulin suppressor-like RCC1 family protein
MNHLNHSIPELSLRSVWILSCLMLASLFMVSSAVLATVLDAGGQQICGIQPDDTVVCWGNITSMVPEDKAFSQISAGGFHSCGILKNKNTIRCWTRTSQEQEGTPPNTFSQVSAGYFHICGITTDNTIKCWGKNTANDYGQATPPDGNFSQVSAGRWHSCGIRIDNTVACWGSNTNPYAKKDGNERQAIPPSGTFLQVSAAMGGWHTCGVRTDNTVACWGSNNHGQAMPPNGTFSQVSTGKWHSCGLRTDNTIACWGSDSDGQATPPSSTFYSVTAGIFATCGVRINNTVACWGANSDRRVESATNFIVKSSIPTSVCFLYGVQDYVDKHDSLNNTQFLTIDTDTFEVNPFGKPYQKLRLQTMDFHPLTNQLYAVTSKGKLHKVDHKTLIQTEFGDIGFKTVNGITFHPDGTLWGWSSKKGLFQFNNNKQNQPILRKANIVLPYQEELKLEDLTWNIAGTILYAVANFEQSAIVWAYKPDEEVENVVSTVCNNLINSLGTEITAMETLPDDTLLFSFRENNNLNLVVIDVQTCERVKQTEISADFNEIKSVAGYDCSLP